MERQSNRGSLLQIWRESANNLRRLYVKWRRPKTIGELGEAAAARHLRRKGYKVVARGSRDQFGELDIVAVDGKTLVFVEVKTRRSHDTGHPSEAVDENKQRQLTRLALYFLKRNDLLEHRARFDVVAVTWPKKMRRPNVQHYINAFEPPGRWQMYS